MNYAFTLPDTENYSLDNYQETLSLLERLQKLKLQKLDEIIHKTEHEVEVLNDEAFISELERVKFFKRTINTCKDKEEKLKKLEIRVVFLKEYITEHEEVFELINNWNLSFNELKIIEEQQKDTTRLFKNRGGSLLQENKKKAAINKKLKRCQKDLLNFEISGKGTNTPHDYVLPKILGHTISEYLDDKVLMYEHEKELERQDKLVAKKKTILQESYYGSSLSTTMKRNKTTPIKSNPRSTKRTKQDKTTPSASQSLRSGFSSNMSDVSKPSTISSCGSATSSNFRKPLSGLKSGPGLRPQSPYKKPGVGKENFAVPKSSGNRVGRTGAKNSAKLRF